MQRKFLGTLRPGLGAAVVPSLPFLPVKINSKDPECWEGTGKGSGGNLVCVRVCVWGGPTYRTDEGHCSSLEYGGPLARRQKWGTLTSLPLGPLAGAAEAPGVGRSASPARPGGLGPCSGPGQKAAVSGSLLSAGGLLLRSPLPPPAARPPPAAENRTFTWLPPAPPSGPASPVLLSHLSSCLLSPHPSPPPPATPQTPPPNP